MSNQETQPKAGSLADKRDYDPPTYRRYEDNAEQWEEWKRQAHAIGFDEAKRHASVSFNNQHRCHDCFCCACWEYVRERRAK